MQALKFLLSLEVNYTWIWENFIPKNEKCEFGWDYYYCI